MLITPAQIRAARALLRLDQKSVAQDAGISVVTLRRLEADDGLGKVAPATVDAVRKVLEQAGARFIDHGVRRNTLSDQDIAAAKARVDAIVARSAALLAQHPPLTDDELYDETGL